jgi:hypothetical protein
MVMAELERNLARRGLDEKRITHRIDQMNGAFPDALVTGYEEALRAVGATITSMETVGALMATHTELL